MNKTIKLLFLEDKISDVKLTELEFKKAKMDYIAKRVETEDDFKAAITNFQPDLILADYNLPSYDGIDAMKFLVEEYPEIPIIIVTGSLDEETAVETMKRGAWDYVLKDHLLRVVPAIKNAMRLKAEKAKKLVAENKSHEREKKYRLVVKNSLLGIYITQKHIIKFCNNTFANIFGYEDYTELVNKHVQILIAPESWDLVNENVKIREAGKEELTHYVFKGKKKDGTIIDIETLGSRIIFSGEPAIQGSLRDITKQRIAETALKASEEKYRLIADNTSDTIAITTFDLKAKYLYVSPSVKSVHGYEVEEMIGKSFFDFTHPEDKLKLLPLVKKYINHKITGLFKDIETPIHETIEFRLRNKNGSWSFMQSNVNLVGDKLIAVSRDITKQKKAEQTLIDNENRFRTLSEAPFEAIFFSEKGICTDQNLTAKKMFGYTIEEAVGKPGTDWIVPEDRKMVMDNMISDYEEPYDITALRKDGSTFPAEIKVRMTLQDGKKIRITALNDISRQKEAEKALKENELKLQKSENELRSLFNSMSDLVFEMDYNGKYKNIAPTNPELMFKPSNELLGKTLHEVFPQEDADMFLGFIQRSLDTNKKMMIEYPLMINDEVHWFEGIANPKTDKTVLFMAHDITNRKITEEELIQMQEYNTNIIESSMDMIISVDNDRKIVEFNKAASSGFGYSKEELLGRNVSMLYFETKDGDRIHQVTEADDNFKGEVMNLRKNGTIFPAFVSSSVLRDKDGKKIGIMGISHDISKRKKAEKEIREKNSLLDSILNRAGNVGITTTDMDFRITTYNPMAKKFFGYPSAHILGKSVREMLLEAKVSSNRIDKAMEIVSKTGEFNFQVAGLTETEENIISCRVTKIVDADGVQVGYSLFSTDITEQVKAEQQIKDDLEEKKVLLKEVHHRVKNNMQIIASLLRMQTRFIKDPSDAQYFNDSLRRVQTMAIVHEKLYQSYNLAKINLHQYVRSLSANLVNSFAVDPDIIKIEIDIHDLYFDINMAIPFGLIINEVMSNSLKYAFVENQKGCIKISLTTSDDIYILKISDDGIGMKADIDIEEPRTLGLQLINALTGQLKAKCEVNTDNGTCYTLRFSEILLKTFRKI
jgi:PAS domain S-box-containing protein